MISSRFYHTGEVTENGMIVTNDLKYCTDITDVTSDFAQPYYMGYLKYDEMPVNMNFGFYILQDRYRLTFTKQTERNHAWGFGTAINHDYRPEGGLVYVDPSLHLVYHPSQYYNPGAQNTVYRFINQANLAGLCYSNVVNVYGRGIIVPAADLDGNDSAYGYTSGNIYSVIGGQISVGVVPGSSSSENIQDWLNGESVLTFPSVTISGETVEIKLSINDFPTDGAPVVRKPITVGGVDYVMFFTIQSYSFPNYAKYDDGNNIYYTAVVPFIEYDDPKGYGEKWYCFGDNTYNGDELRIVLDYFDGNFIESVSPIGREYYTTGFLGDYFIEGGEIWGSEDNIGSECWWWRTSEDNLNHYPGWGRTGIIRGRHIFTSESSSTGAFHIAKMVYPKDIYNHYMLFHKVDTLHNTQQGTVATQTYTTDYAVALFDELDKPLNERVEEDFGASLLAKLRPWQYPNMDMSINIFTIDDVPPYEPTPSGDEERSGGVDYTHNGTFTTGTASGFVTQYVLNAEQLASLGSYLWSSFTNSDFVESLLVTAGETFSLDTSKILEFIVSVRQYPIGIQHLDSFDSVADTIYIGRGLYGINLQSGDDIGVLTSYCEGVEGGFCKVPIEDKWKDFRGYEPCARVTVIVPFCGSLELTPSQAIGSTIYLDYAIDFSCGAVQACITIDNGRNKYIAGVLDGSIGANIELTASNLSQMLLKGMKSISTIVGAIALGAVGAEAAEASAMAGYESAKTVGDYELVGSRLAESNTRNTLNFGSSISSIGNMSVSPSAHIGTASGFAAFQITEPIVRVEYRHYEVPSNYPHIYGYACNKTVTLGSLEGKGFTVCKNVDLTGVPATQDELAALEALLQSGVYL